MTDIASPSVASGSTPPARWQEVESGTGEESQQGLTQPEGKQKAEQQPK